MYLSRAVGVKLKILLGVLLLLALAGAESASAAETTVNFDGLAAETLVKGQYEGVGLKLGSSKELGAPSPGQGDCGPPTVKEDAALQPPSPPKYALLPACVAPGSMFHGTFGQLLKHPAGQLSLYVRDLSIGVPPISMELIAYEPSGKQIGVGKGSASSEGWTQIKLSTGAAQAGFFLVRTKEAIAAGEIAIDNLAFPIPPEEEVPTTSTSSTTQAPPPVPPVPPVAVLSQVTPSPHSGQPVTLSGAGSSPGSGQIISYEWDFNGDGKTDTSTGSNPTARTILTNGTHMIGLTVTNSNGESSSSRLGVVISGLTLPPAADGGEGPCESVFEVLNVQLSAECIQKAPGGGYVIQSRQLGLNGMVMVPKGGGYGLWRIDSKRHLGVGTEYKLSGSPVSFELPNTPIGDMVLGGYDLQSQPLTLATAYEHQPKLNVKVTSKLRAHAADEERVKNLKGVPLLSFGVGHACKPGSKDVGCCPPPGPTKACATLPGNFPLTGQVVVYLTGKGQAVFDLQVGLDLKSVNFQATGELELLTSTSTGIELSSLRFTIPEASLAPIFKVKEASFVYYFPGNPDPERRDTWQAKATITFGLLEEPGLEGELSFQHGQFHSAGLALTLPPPGVPIYPGISLNKMGASVGVEPITFGGVLGAKIASVLELELAFKYAEATEAALGFFGGKGTLKYEDNEIATLEADVYSDGYSDAQLQLKIGVPFGSKEPVVSAEGELGYWDEAKTGLWEAYGRIHAKIWVIEGEVAGLVNNHFIAGCGYLGPFGALGYWDFDTSSPGGEGFFGGNCHDDLKPYRQVPMTQHTGGFVNESETESLRAAPVAAGLASAGRRGPDATVAVAANPLGRDLRISSSSGTPVVTLSGPGGQSFTTPASPGQVVTSGSQFIAALGSDPHQVIVYVKTPAGGTWHLHRAPGSAPISKVEVAEVAPPPSLQASVHKLRSGRWKLSYRAKNLTPGSKVRFYERGKDSIHGLGTVTASHGSISFTPAQALGRSRAIYATVIASAGNPLQTLTVGHYTAPRAFRPGRVDHVRFARRGNSALLSWGAVSGARLYRVRIKGSDGRLVTLFAKAGRRRASLANVLGSESFTATVTAVGGVDLLAGRPASAKLPAVRSKRRRG